MATLTVTTADDYVDANDGKLSLREALTQANISPETDTILFANAIEGRVLQLTQGELNISRDVIIDGDRNDDGVEVTLNGSGRSWDGSGHRIISIVGGETDATLNDLTIANGYSPYESGGGIHVGGGSLKASGLTVRQCSTDSYSGGGGGIFASAGSRIELVASSIVDNGAGGRGGGGIFAEENAELILRKCVVSGNGTSNYGSGGGVLAHSLTVEDSIFSDNRADSYGLGGAMAIYNGVATIVRSSINSNGALRGGGIFTFNADATLQSVTVADNTAGGSYYVSQGGGILVGGSGRLSLIEATITSNSAVNDEYPGEGALPIRGGGVSISGTASLEIANSIIAGNLVRDDSGRPTFGPDIFGSITSSNGHNIFGSDVTGNVVGDKESLAPGLLFAALDPETGGGLLNASGIVPLRNAITNPALNGGDLIAASAAGQLGGTGRPLPAGSLPDIGSIEINQALSTKASANNDVLTGTAAANTISGLAGADYLKGLAGNDTLNGGDGGDLLDGGAGNDKLNGDAGIDLVFYGGSTKVTVDLSLKTDTAKRGSETDTLTNVEGAIGSSAADSFKGNEYNNYFQGGGGKDTATGGGGRDLYDFNAIADSKSGATTRDVITDFGHLIDKIDLMGIDADTSVAGNQAFRWVGTSALTGPGEVGFFTSGGNTIVRASNDADAASEFEIQLTGSKALTVTDFYL